MSAPAFRAINTRYKGYNFRSRLEARWAVFFDHLGIRWDYEPEGFELGNGLRYLPDFWLPDVGLWVEVKPGALDTPAREKAWRLALNTGHPVFVTHGLPDGPGRIFVTSMSDFGELTEDGDCGLEYPAVVSWHKGARTIGVMDDRAENDRLTIGELVCKQLLNGPSFRCFPSGTRLAPVTGVALKALDAARSARFEFGEKGGL